MINPSNETELTIQMLQDAIKSYTINPDYFGGVHTEIEDYAISIGCELMEAHCEYGYPSSYRIIAKIGDIYKLMTLYLMLLKKEEII